MMKKLILIFVSLIAIISIGCYLFLTEKIIDGESKILAGQKKLAEGEQLLAKGKARLAAGKKQMASVNKVRRGINAIPFMNITKKIPVGGDVLKIANSKVDEGNQMIAKGQEKIKAGEKQLAEGKLKLKQGLDRLSHAKSLQFVCKMGAISFTLLSIILMIVWRKPLFCRPSK